MPRCEKRRYRQQCSRRLREGLGEPNASICESVNVWGGVPMVSIAAYVISSKGVNHDDNDVRLFAQGDGSLRQHDSRCQVNGDTDQHEDHTDWSKESGHEYTEDSHPLQQEYTVDSVVEISEGSQAEVSDHCDDETSEHTSVYARRQRE